MRLKHYLTELEDSEQFYKPPKGKVFTKLAKPLTRGKKQECYENARKEYLAQKAKGRKAVYWKGTIYGYNKAADKSKFIVPVQHCFVTVGNTVYDSTPFDLNGREVSAIDYWDEIRYIGQKKIDSDFAQEISTQDYLRM